MNKSDHSPTESDLADDLSLDDYDDAKLYYNADMDFNRSIGTKLGVMYEYPLTKTLNLIASGEYRSLELDVLLKEKISSEADIDVIEEYYQDEFEFQPPSNFTEDFGGYEVGLGLNFRW